MFSAYKKNKTYQGVFLTQMKNCDPFVSLPALAMDNHPAP